MDSHDEVEPLAVLHIMTLLASENARSHSLAAKAGPFGLLHVCNVMGQHIMHQWHTRWYSQGAAA